MNLREPYIQKGLASIGLVLVLVWLIFLTDYLPISQKSTERDLDVLRKELEDIGGELQRLHSAVNSLPRIREELSNLEKKWDTLRSLLPKQTEMSSLLTKVTTSGLKAGIQFSLFEPLQPEPFDLYTRYPVRVKVIGGYHQVGRFFDNLCNMERLVGISEVRIDQISRGKDAHTIESSAMISAYTYDEGRRRAETNQETKSRKGAREPKG